jgi:threonine/homoserine/homoserine lactone efflux protein
MLLQIAVGPVCLFIFQTAAISGFLPAGSGVIAVVLVDALFIFAALAGIGALIEKRPGLKATLKYAGAAVLILFGLNLVIGSIWTGFLPALNLSETAGADSAFLRAALITFSCPLTILFWAGVFAQRAAEQNLDKRGMALYGLGAVLSTLASLTVVAALGGLTHTFLSEPVIRVLNLIVGLVLIGFGVWTAVKKA